MLKIGILWICCIIYRIYSSLFNSEDLGCNESIFQRLSVLKMLKKELQNWDFNARIKHVFYSYVEVTIPAGTNKWCILASLFTEERRFKITYALISYIVNYLRQKANPVYIFGDFGDPKNFGVKNYRYSLNCCKWTYIFTLPWRKINMLHNSLTFIKIKLQNFEEEKKMRK